MNSDKGKGEKQLIAPVPQRKYNLGHLGFMQYEGVKFFSENINISRERNTKQTRATSFREANPDKKKSRLQQIKEKQAKFGLSINFKKIDEEAEGTSTAGDQETPLVKEEDIALDDRKETKDSSEGQGSNFDPIKAETKKIDMEEIDRCSNPMSNLLEGKEGFEFEHDFSISEEDEDDEDSIGL